MELETALDATLDATLNTELDLARDSAQDIGGGSAWCGFDGYDGNEGSDGSAESGRLEDLFGPCRVPDPSDAVDASDDARRPQEPETSGWDFETPGSSRRVQADASADAIAAYSNRDTTRDATDDSDGVVWRQAGATIFVPRGAPDPRLFQPRLDEPAIERLFVEKRRARELGIDGLVREAERTKPVGAPERDRFVARIRWDTEFAPKTTNRRQLAEIGVDIPTREQIPVNDAEMRHELWRVIYGLARLGIFFTETDGISDRAMLEMLAGRVLEDSVSDIPPNGDMSEFIALCPPDEDESAETAESTSSPPDGLRGPYETDEDDDGSWDAWDAMDALDAVDAVDATDPGDATGVDDPGRPLEGPRGSARGPVLGAPGDPGFPERARSIPPELRRDHLLPQPWRE